MKPGCVAQTHSTRIESNRYLEKMERPLFLNANSKLLEAAQKAIKNKMQSRNLSDSVGIVKTVTASETLVSGVKTGYIEGYGIPVERRVIPKRTEETEGLSIWKIMTIASMTACVGAFLLFFMYLCYRMYHAIFVKM